MKTTIRPTKAVLVWPAWVRPRAAGRGFTLVELLTVVAVISALLALSVPAINSLKNSADVASAAYDLSDALSRARTFAVANGTYVWVGIFEENAGTITGATATPGTGRLVVSTVYSKDGTNLYTAATDNKLTPAMLAQVGPLLKIEQAHLYAYTDGTGAGGGFAGRPSTQPPAGGGDTTRISDVLPATPCPYTFTYPLGGSRYTFNKMIQFSPRGESRINCTQALVPLIEIGLARTRGTVVDTASKNIVAIQVSGIASDVKIYRP